MERQSREVWVKRVERWQDSGLTAKEFATEIGVNYHTLQHWKYRLARAGRASLAGDAAGEALPPEPSHESPRPLMPAVSFVELATPAPKLDDSRFELQLC